jgi:4-amino-4-deoxy-L-arabinose transferase-like glycosyltransferase
VADRPPGAGAAALAAALVAAPFLLAALGAAGLDDPGEGMHAEIARELLASGDPLVLTLNGVRYVDKPPLLYLIGAAAIALAGPSEAAARLAPALAALAAVGATAWVGARLLSPVHGALAGLALLGSPLLFVFGRYVRPETLFVAALAAGFALTLDGLASGSRRQVGLGVVAFGVAGLAKDPLGLVMPLAAILLALALTGRARRALRLVPAPAALAAAVLGMGWWLVAEARTPGALWYAVIDNKVLNVAGARVFPDEDVPLGAAEFLAVALLGCLPWSAAAAVAVASLVRRRAWRDARELPWVVLALWVVGLLALTALSRFRLPHYGLPAYPAVALLAARAWAVARPAPLAAAHAVLFGLLAAACAAAWLGDGASFLAAVSAGTDVATRKSVSAGGVAPFPDWAAIGPLVGHAALALAGGAAGMVALLAAWRAGRGAPPAGPARGAVAMAVAAVAMIALLPAAGAALALVADHRSARQVGRVLAREAGPGDLVVHEGPIEASGALEWYSGRRPVIVDGRRSVLAFGATRVDAQHVFWDEARVREAWRAGTARVWIVSVRPPERSLAAGLPGARRVHAGPARWLYVSP